MAVQRMKKQAPAKIKKIVKTSPVVVEKKATEEKYIATVGRRKVASARIRLSLHAGEITVNGKPMLEYFKVVDPMGVLSMKPFKVVGLSKAYASTVKVVGSGLSSQLEAVNHGISRALAIAKPEYRVLLKKAGLLTRDDRMRESRKMGKGGKSRRAKQSPKR